MVAEITGYLNKNLVTHKNKVYNNFKKNTRLYTHYKYRHTHYLQFYKVKTSVTKFSAKLFTNTSALMVSLTSPHPLGTILQLFYHLPKSNFYPFALESCQVLESHGRRHTCSQMLSPNPRFNQEQENAASAPQACSGHKKHL